jgi:hypothetical protein
MIDKSGSLPSNIKRKPWLIDQLPWVGRGTSTALYPNVWLSAQTYDDLVGAYPDPYNVALLLHEQEHITRMKQMRPIRWVLRYMTSNRFRFEEELAALHPQFAYIKHEGLDFNMEHRARVLSGWLYFWPVGNEEALRRLNQLWDKV